MSYGVLYTCTHKVDTGGTSTTYTIEILKKSYTGFPQELVGWEETFLLEYDRVNVREPFKTPINQGRMEFYVAIRSSDELDLLNEVFSGEEDTHQLRLKKDGTVIWTGFVLKDLLQYSNGDYPYRATIIAKDLTRLSQFTFPLSQGRQKLIVTIADLLNDVGLGLDIYTYTSWDNDSFQETDDFLNLTWHELQALRNYGRNGDEEDQPSTNQFWLDALLRNFGLILRQADGAWRIYQISALGSSVSQYRYNSSGVQQSSGSIDLRTTIDSGTKYLLPSSENFYLPAIKKAQVTWNHRTKVSGIKLPNEVNLVEGQSQVFNQLFLSDGEQTITFKTDIFASFSDNSNIDITNSCKGQIEFKIEGTQRYYLQDDLSWSTSYNLIEPKLLLTKPTLAGFDVRGGASFTTDKIPSDADGTLSIRFTGALSIRNYALTTQYTSFEFVINNDTTQKNSESLAYQLTQSGNYSYNYDHGTVYFGDGPTSYSDSALRFGNRDANLITDGWKKVGELSSDSFFKLLLREFVDLQTYGLRVLEADIYGVYNLSNILNYESSLFFPLGGSLSGNNTWRLDFLNISYVDSGSTFGESVSSGGSTIPGASSQQIVDYWSTVKASNFFNTVFLQNYVGELSAVLQAGSRTSATANLSAQLREGEDFIIIDKENEKPYFINITDDVNTGEDQTIDFDEQYFPVNLPVGSPIVMTGGLLQSYFTIDPTKLSISVDGERQATSLGYISTITPSGIPISSITLSKPGLSASNKIVVKDNQVLTLQRRSGQTQEIVVNGDQTFTSSPYTLNVDTFTPAFSMAIQTDLATFLYEPGYKSASRISLTESSIELSVQYNDNGSYIELLAGPSGSEITLQADQINITGVITAINSEGTTTIDGGRITADSITASQIAAGTITATEIATGTITANEIATGTITADKIDVEDLFSESIEVGNLIKSSNYVAGTSGFILSASGTAEFREVIVEGEIVTGTGSDIDGDYISNINAGTITAGTLSADRIGASSITADKINVTNLNSVSSSTGSLTVDNTITIGTGGSIRDSAYSAGTSGFSINADGSAEFNDVTVRGTVDANSGTLANLTVDGSITVGTGGSIESSNFSTGSAGFQINADGSAEFNDVIVRTGSYSGTSDGLLIDEDEVVFNVPVTLGNAGTIGKWNFQSATGNQIGTLQQIGAGSSAAFLVEGNTGWFVLRSESGTLVSDTSIAVLGDDQVVSLPAQIQMNSPLLIGSGNADTNYELTVNGDVRWNGTTSSSATAGSNGDVPAQVQGYLQVNISGTNYKIPYYNT